MKQFIITGDPADDQVRIEGSDYKYLVHVRRLAAGEFFPAVLPDGTMVNVKVQSIDRHTLVGRIFRDGADRAKTLPARTLPSIILYQALPKNEKMDLIVRQAAESALTGIVPFAAEYSMVKITNSGHKLLRWERIIREARQQSGSPVTTTIQKPVSIDGLFEHWNQLTIQQPGTIGLLFHHLPLENESLHGYLGKIIAQRSDNFQSDDTIVIAIGPEGGFSPDETERFLTAGFRPFILGDTILRTETAALYAQAVVRILLWERNSWEVK
ncbi:MAG: 16S rRNA (uracil(1498)-N(3))-methyltransferase [Treponema sp.]|nr:16S rRNA (uracil(1498)-N(3))-methyltransferase [Treponema sp.]